MRRKSIRLFLLFTLPFQQALKTDYLYGANWTTSNPSFVDLTLTEL
jgi:hypothetical protein